MTPREKLTELVAEYRRTYGLSRAKAIRAIRRDLQEVNKLLRGEQAGGLE